MDKKSPPRSSDRKEDLLNVHPHNSEKFQNRKERRKAEALRRKQKPDIYDVLFQNLEQRSDLCVSLGFSEWKEDDRIWFEKHQTRSFRLRPIGKGEPPIAAYYSATHVLVRQLEPGCRDKKFVFIADTESANDPRLQSEEFLSALWHASINTSESFISYDATEAKAQEFKNLSNDGRMQ